MDSQGKEKVLYIFASIILVLVFLWQSYSSLDKYMEKNTGYHLAQKVKIYKGKARVPQSNFKSQTVQTCQYNHNLIG